MKKTVLTAVLICIAALFSLQSCTKDDDVKKSEPNQENPDNNEVPDNNDPENPLVGTWKMVEITTTINGTSQTVKYDNMTYMLQEYTPTTCTATSYVFANPSSTTIGDYTLDGNKVVLNKDAIAESMTFRFIGDTLVFENVISKDYQQILKLVPYSGKIDIVDNGNSGATNYAKDLIGTWRLQMAVRNGYDDESKNGTIFSSLYEYSTIVFTEDNRYTLTIWSRYKQPQQTSNITYSLNGSVISFSQDGTPVSEITIISLNSSELTLLVSDGDATTTNYLVKEDVLEDDETGEKDREFLIGSKWQSVSITDYYTDGTSEDVPVDDDNCIVLYFTSIAETTIAYRNGKQQSDYSMVTPYVLRNGELIVQGVGQAYTLDGDIFTVTIDNGYYKEVIVYKRQ